MSSILRLLPTLLLELALEEPPLLVREAGPPLARLPVAAAHVEHAVQEAGANLAPDLSQVLPQLGRLAGVLRLLKESVEREVCVAGQSKVLQCEREHVLPALLLVGHLGQLLQAEADVQDAVDEHQVRLLSYLEGGEEDVGLEEVEALVDDVLLVGGDGGRRGA